MRQFRGHSIPVERFIITWGPRWKQASGVVLTGTILSLRSFPSWRWSSPKPPRFGLMTPTKARLWWEFLYVCHR